MVKIYHILAYHALVAMVKEPLLQGHLLLRSKSWRNEVGSLPEVQVMFQETEGPQAVSHLAVLIGTHHLPHNSSRFHVLPFFLVQVLSEITI